MKTRSLRSAAIALIAATAMIGTAVVGTITAVPAHAWSTTDFNPGNIIDDSLFYDGTAMTAADVQAFLERRVPDCTIGDPGRAAGSAWGSTRIASKCLRNFTMTTTSKPASAFCAAYNGRSNESASMIIAKVAKSCGISPRVLLITLEKEQSLVTDSWPTVRQFDVAMGYACPDSGPGNSANCNSEYFGFFNQVHRAAWQLNVYKAFPERYNFQKGDTETIQWHPDRARCGTSQVRIANYATAALYTYTPYRPNAAALRAGWGHGDNCSSYGNRNFFNFWNSWFGSVRADVQLTPSMQAAYDAAAAAGLDLGDPISPRQTIRANGGGYQIRFEGGLITQSTKLGKSFAVHNGGWTDSYLDADGASGSWGFIAGTQTDTANGFKTLAFQNGQALYTLAYGVQYMPDEINTAWEASGGWQGPFGFPTESAYEPTSNSASQVFEHAVLMASGTKSTQVSHADYERWQQAGGYAKMGFFTGPSVAVGDRSYRSTERGVLYFPSATDSIYITNGEFSKSYLAAGGPDGAWGWPTVEKQEHVYNGGSEIRFENGIAVHSPGTGVAFLSQAAYDDWVTHLGGSSAAVGFPVGDTLSYEDGFAQQYGRYLHFVGPDTRIEILTGLYSKAYLEAGGPDGAWGWPTVEKQEHVYNGGSEIRFENGIAVHSPGTGVAFLSQAAYDDWVTHLGGSSAAVGFPVGDTLSYEDGFAQQYGRYLHFVGPDTRIEILTGLYSKAYLEAGGPDGAWGWPTVEKRAHKYNGGSEIRFENGIAVHSPGTGVAFLSQAAYDDWVTHLGGSSAAVGFPVGDTLSYEDGFAQQYGRYLHFVGPDTRIEMLVGSFTESYLAAGGPDGAWGWPTAAEVKNPDGSSRIVFENGTATYTPGAGVTFTAA